ncbi:MAG: xanthine dehydrogenase family protein molybdopterin-binding subunit [Oscillospiraceae bacterium]|nr:xanthine dehydrogenase family protein molybdopterin-binding subunit [Oscillospiraceae bacterium]
MNTLIGKGEKRIDAYDKVTGKGMFASDFFSRAAKMPQMRLLTSPHAHAKILRLDVSRAENMPGVIKIITSKEPGVDWDQFPKPAYLAQDRVIWAGQVIALVLAETREIAEEAIGAIEIEYEVYPHVLNYDEAMEPNPKAVVDPEYETRAAGFSDRPGDRASDRKSPNVVGAFKLNTGDVDRALKESDIVIEHNYFTGKKTANPLETATAVCEYSPDGTLTMTSNGAGVHGVIKQTLCRVLGLKQSKLRCIQPYQGGSFGSRLNPFIEVLTALMASRAKCGVACSYTRKESFTTGPSNWPCYTTVKLGAKKDGTIIANDFTLGEEIGACINNSFFSGRLSSSGVAPCYRFPNTRMDTFAVATNTVPAAEYRGLGCPETEFGIECVINELADGLGISPVEIRLKNILDPGDLNIYGEPIRSTGLKKCLQSVADAIGVDEKPVQDMGVWKKGRGCAVGGKQNTPLGRAEAKVWFNCDGTIELFTSVDEMGMGATTTMAQICANEMGVRMEDVKLTNSDTAITPYDNYSASSRATYTAGNAVIIACDDLKRKLKEEVAREFGMHPSKVEIQGTTAILKGAALESVSIPSLFKGWTPFSQNNWGLKIGSPVEGVGIFCPAPVQMWDKDGRSPRIWNWFQYSAAAIEVAVNEETGQVQVLRVASSSDTGNPINPDIIRGQTIGGVHMAIGFALNEEHLYDENGMISNANLSDYRLPTILDMPLKENVHDFINPDSLPDGPYGAKGMAESVTVPVAPAIQEAIYQAVGVRINGYPMTAERVLAAIKEKKQKEAAR